MPRQPRLIIPPSDSDYTPPDSSIENGWVPSEADIAETVDKNLDVESIFPTRPRFAASRDGLLIILAFATVILGSLSVLGAITFIKFLGDLL